MPESTAHPAIDPPAVADEPLSEIETRLLTLAHNEANRLRADADKAFGEQMAFLVRAHGHNPNDGRNYTFGTEAGAMFLRIASK